MTATSSDNLIETKEVLTVADLLRAARKFKDIEFDKLPTDLEQDLVLVADFLEINWKGKKVFEVLAEVEKRLPGELKLSELDKEKDMGSVSLNEQDLRELLDKLNNEKETSKPTEEAEKSENQGKEAVANWKSRLQETRNKVKESLEKTSWGRHLKESEGKVVAGELAKEVEVSAWRLEKEVGSGQEEAPVVIRKVLTEITERNLENRFAGLPTQREFNSAIAITGKVGKVQLSVPVLDKIAQEVVLLTSNQAAAQVAFGVAKKLGGEEAPSKELLAISKNYVDGTVDFKVFQGQVLLATPKLDKQKSAVVMVSIKSEADNFKNTTLGVIRQASALAELTARSENFTGQDLNKVKDRVSWLAGKVAHTPMANSVIVSGEGLGERNTTLRAAGLLGIASLGESDLEEAKSIVSGFRSAGGQANSFMLGIIDGVEMYSDPEARPDFAKLQARVSGLNSGDWIQSVGNLGLGKAKELVWQKVGGEKVIKSLITGLGEKLGLKQMVSSVAAKKAVETVAGATAKKVAGGLLAKGLALLGLQAVPGVGQAISLALIAKDLMGGLTKIAKNLVKKIKPEDMLATVGAIGLAGATMVVGVVGAVGTALMASGFAALGPIVVGTFAYLFISGNSTNNHNAAILPPNQKEIVERSPRLAKIAGNALPPNNGVRPADLQEDCPWGWPVNSPFVVVQGPHGPYSHSAIEAIDIFGNGYDLAGMPIFATHVGVVEAGGSEGNSYGYYVDVVGTCNGVPIRTRYAHMPGLEIASGTEVKSGTVLGHADNSGTFREANSVSHVHYEVISSSYPLNKFLPKNVPNACYDYTYQGAPWPIKCLVSGP